MRKYNLLTVLICLAIALFSGCAIFHRSNSTGKASTAKGAPAAADISLTEVARIAVKGRVLDRRTGKPVPNVTIHFVGAPGDNATTDADGHFSAVGDRARFHQTLLLGEGQSLIAQVGMNNHMDESLAKNLAFHIGPIGGYNILKDDDQDGVFCAAGQNCVICSNSKDKALDVGGAPSAGDISLTVHVSLTVRGVKSEAPDCRVCIMEGTKGRQGNEVRRIERSSNGTYEFVDLTPGYYTIEAYFWDSHPTHNEAVILRPGENKTVYIDAKTEEVGRIAAEGRVLNRRTGKPLPGITIHFVGAPDDNATTDADGHFSAIGDRARFHQTVLLGENDEMIAEVQMNNHMDETLARNLTFHLGPAGASNVLTDDDQDGVFCAAGQDCAICPLKKHE